jgi:hypothetical protein
MTESVTRVSTSGTGNAGEKGSVRGFAMIYANILRHPDLSKGAICHYGNLLLYARQDGKCWPGQERLAKDIRASVRQVHRYNKELEAAGLIETEQRPLEDGINQTNVYTITGLLDTPCYQASTRAMDRTSMSDRDRTPVSDEVEAVEVEAVITPKPPKIGGTKEKEKEKAGTGTAGTSSFDAKRDPKQNRAGEVKVKERSPRKRRPRAGTVQTPDEGLQALTDHRDRLGGASMERYVPVAKRWDFTQDNPPWWVMKELNNEHQLLARVEKIVRGAVRKAEVDALNAKKERGHVSPDSTPDAPVQASPSEPDPNSVEAMFAASRAQEAENTAILKAYMKAYPERCAFDGF